MHWKGLDDDEGDGVDVGDDGQRTQFPEEDGNESMMDYHDDDVFGGDEDESL